MKEKEGSTFQLLKIQKYSILVWRTPSDEKKVQPLQNTLDLKTYFLFWHEGLLPMKKKVQPLQNTSDVTYFCAILLKNSFQERNRYDENILSFQKPRPGKKRCNLFKDIGSKGVFIYAGTSTQTYLFFHDHFRVFPIICSTFIALNMSRTHCVASCLQASFTGNNQNVFMDHRLWLKCQVCHTLPGRKETTFQTLSKTEKIWGKNVFILLRRWLIWNLMHATTE